MLNQSKLTEVLLNLADKGQSGVFRAQKGNAKKQLVFNNGAIAFAESNQPDEHLARIMILMGFLEKSDLREVVSLMKKGKNSEEAVSSVYHSDGEDIGKGTREQVIVILSSLLGWDDVDMRFFSGEDLIKNRRNMELNVPGILVSSVRRAVSKHLVSVPPGFLQGTITAPKAQSALRMKLPLNTAESYAYTRAHDKISTVELLPLIPADDASPEEVLQRLYILGLIEPEKSRDAVSSDAAESAVSDEFLMLIEDMLIRFEGASLYEILSVKSDAGINEIQTVYHDLAKQFHPDRFQSKEFTNSMRNQVEQVFAYINQAYMTLRDPDLRSRYDETRITKGDEAAAPIKSMAFADAEEEKMIEALFKQGCNSIAQVDFEQAAKELKSCVYLRPEKANYNFYLGLAESEIPRLYKSAEGHFLKAIELESMSANYHIALVKLYMKAGLPRKAAGLLEELMRWDPDNPEANNLLQELKKD